MYSQINPKDRSQSRSIRGGSNPFLPSQRRSPQGRHCVAIAQHAARCHRHARGGPAAHGHRRIPCMRRAIVRPGRRHAFTLGPRSDTLDCRRHSWSSGHQSVLAGDGKGRRKINLSMIGGHHVSG